MTLGETSIRRPVGTITLVVCALVIGFFALGRLAVDLLPRIIYPRIFVSLEFEGADPQVVEEQVTKVVEQEMATTEGLVRIYSVSREGAVRFWLFFDFSRNIDLALQDAITKFNVARRNLPEEVQNQIQNARIFKSDPAQIPIVEFALASEALKGTKLQTWAKQVLVPQLMVVPGVASVEAFGGQDEEVQVYVDFPRLQGMGLTLTSVLHRLRSENMDVTGGRVDTAEREYSSRTAGKLRSVQEIARLIVPTPDGRKVYLRDFARVVDGGEERRLFAWFNGRESVKVVVLKQPDANTVSMVDGLTDRLAFLKRNNIIPKDVSLTPTYDQSFFIRAAIRNVLESALVGGILATLVVLAFFGSLRRTAIIALAIPVASVFTFFLMWAGGLTFNIFSLGGLAIGVGMLVDNAIVMLENISRHQGQGGDPVAAAQRASREVESALMASTLTNVASVVPFLFISGIVSLLFRELILTVTIAFICSLLMALTAVAMLSARLLQLPQTSGLGRTLPFRSLARSIEGLIAGYRRSLPTALRLRWAVIPLALAVCAGSLLLLPGLGRELLPEVDDGRVTVDVRLSQGVKLEYTKEVTGRIHDMLRADPEVQDAFAVAGGFLFGRGVVRNSARGRVEANLKPGYSVFDYLKKLRARLARLDIPDARVYAYKSHIRGLRTSNSVHNKSFSLSVRGDDLATLQRLAQELVERVRDVPGLANLQVDQDEPRPEFQVRLDRERAAEFGLSVEEVGNTVNTAVDGSIATYLNREDRRVPVRVKLLDTQVRSAQDLESLPLFPPGRAPIRLGHVGQVKIGQGSSEIVRMDQSRTMEITGDLTDRSLGEVSGDVRERLAELKMPSGYYVLPGDDEEVLKRSNRELLILAALAIFLVYAVMAIQYDSFVNPFVIMFSVPPALSGAVLGLYLTGASFGAPALVGVLILVGYVVNNAIVMVEFIEQVRERGLPRREAIVAGAAVRLRPILMSSLTTTLGMTPLALGWGQGTEMLRPLGIVALSGLSFSLLITLFLTPCLYEVTHGGVARLRRWVGVDGARPAAVSAAPAAGAIIETIQEEERVTRT